MKVFFLSIILLTFYFPLKGQNPYNNKFIDSTKSVLQKNNSNIDYSKYAEILMSISDAFLYQGKADSSIKYLELINVNKLIKNENKFNINYLFGKSYNAKGLYFSALQYSYKSLHFAENTKNKMFVSKTYSLLANINGLLNQNRQSINWHKKAIRIYEKNPNFEKNYYLTLNNMGNCYKRLGKLDSAKLLYNTVLKYKLSKNDKFWEATLYSNLSEVLLLENDFKHAIEYSKKAYAIDVQFKDTISLFNDNILLAEAYLKLKEYKKAYNYAKKAEFIGQKLDLNSEKLILYNILYQLYKKMNSLEKAIFYQSKTIELKTLIFENELSKKISSQKLDYELLNEKQINLTQKSIIEIQKKNTYLYLISSFLLFLLLCLFIYFYVNSRKKNIIINLQNESIKEINSSLETKVEERTEELSEANKELVLKNFEITEALFKGKTLERKRVAAELHDNLGSTLSALKWRLGALNSDALNPKEKEIYESIKAMMGTAYEDVRHISHNLLPESFEKYGLLGALNKLINEINENSKIKFDFIKNGSFDQLDNILSLELYSICLELINNTIKHSFANIAKLELKSQDNLITIKLYDNGIGIKQTNSNNGKGFRLIKNRIKNINGNFHINYNEKSGTEIMINAPIN